MATTEIYTLSLHDALPIFVVFCQVGRQTTRNMMFLGELRHALNQLLGSRSEEHTSELQSRGHLVCRLLLEKKNSDRCMIDPPTFHFTALVPQRFPYEAPDF